VAFRLSIDFPIVLESSFANLDEQSDLSNNHYGKILPVNIQIVLRLHTIPAGDNFVGQLALEKRGKDQFDIPGSSLTSRMRLKSSIATSLAYLR
jgi:hypothetical protein